MAGSTRRWSGCPGTAWGPVRAKARGPASGYCRTCRRGRNCRGHLNTEHTLWLLLGVCDIL